MKKIEVLLIIFIISISVITISLLVLFINSKADLVIKQQKELQLKDSLFTIEQIKYRKELTDKIDKLDSTINVLNTKNSKIEKSFKEQSTNYQNNKYKPIKYWK